MALRGSYIGDGYISNRGMVRVYQDLDNPGFLFCDLQGRDETLFVARSRVQFRRSAGASPKADKPASSAAHWEQPTLF